MLVTAALRACQILFSVVILGISVSLAKGQSWDSSVPSQTSYAAFCGGLGLVIAVIGIAALFVTFLQGIVIVALDALMSLFLLAGGITFWATLGVHSCSDSDYTQSNVIIRGAGYLDGFPAYNGDDNLVGRCQQAQATTAFLFFAFIAFTVTAMLGLRYRNGGPKGSVV